MVQFGICSLFLFFFFFFFVLILNFAVIKLI